MTIKYQYLKPSKYDVALNPKLNGLCITIATDLVQNSEKQSTCFWVVAFKNPKDQFVKAEARKVIAHRADNDVTWQGKFAVSNKYTRNELLVKILMELHIREYDMTTPYVQYVRWLLADSSFTDYLV